MQQYASQCIIQTIKLCLNNFCRMLEKINSSPIEPIGPLYRSLSPFLEQVVDRTQISSITFWMKFLSPTVNFPSQSCFYQGQVKQWYIFLFKDRNTCCWWGLNSVLHVNTTPHQRPHIHNRKVSTISMALWFDSGMS